MSKVLVTGASGFVGAHLSQALVARGDEVTALVRRTSQVGRLQALSVRLAYGDITDPAAVAAAVRGAEVVYHVAGTVRSLRSRDFYRINAQGAANVAQACAAQSTPPILVHVSSLAAAGPAPCGRPRRETDPPVQVSHYGRSKYAGELAVRRVAGRVPITIVRPPIVLGEMDPVSAEMFRSIRRFGVHMVPGIGRYRFSVIHAADLATLLILAASAGRRLPADLAVNPGEGIYFGAAEVDPTYTDLGRMIAKALGRRGVFTLHVSSPIIWLASAVGDFAGQVVRKPLFLNLDKAWEITAGSWTCSAEAARRDLGFTVAAPLQQRLDQTARWYLREGWI